MDSVASAAPVTQNDKEAAVAANISMVDPFLVEALQNPRHRLTILRMELEIQKFLQNSDLQKFEFQHFPTSYLRLAAHRVAQHYGLQSLVQDSGLDGQGTKILVRKKPESRLPAVCLSDVPAKQLETDKHEKIKIAVRPRPKKSSVDNGELGSKRNPARTVEERKEEYDRARARIFRSPSSSELEDPLGISDGKTSSSNVEDNESSKNSVTDMDKNIQCRETGPCRVAAIFRDREKDRTDPDYDRSYERYVKNVPAHQSFSLMPYVQKFQHPYLQYDALFSQPSQMPGMQAAVNYRSPVMTPFCATVLNQPSRDGVYLQWPSQSMMYAHSYDHLRHAVFQTPMCQQPLSFDYSQNH